MRGRALESIAGLRWVVAASFAVATLLYVTSWMVAVRYRPLVELGYDAEYIAAEQAQLVTRVQRDSPAEQAGLREGDHIVAIDGLPLTDANYQARTWNLHAVGDRVRLTLRRPGTSATFDVTGTFRRRIGTPSAADVTVTGYVADTILAFYPVPFVTVGLAVLFLRIDDRRAWLLALMFAGFASTPGFPDSIDTFAPRLRPFVQIYQGVMISLFAPLFYLFFATFPARSPLDRRLPWLKWAGLAASVPIALASVRTGALRLPPPFPHLLGTERAEQAGIWWLLAMLTLGLVSLAANFLAATDQQARRKTRVMFWGTVAGLGPNVVLVAASSLLSYREPGWLAAFRAVCAFLLPLSMAYAVVKHRVLELPVLIRRGARYLLVQRGFTALLALASIAITLAVARWFAPQGTTPGGVSGVGLGAALGMLLLWGGSQVHRRVGERIDRAFFRQAYDARGVLQDLASRAGTVTDRAQLAGLLQQHVSDALHPAGSAVFLRGADDRFDVVAGAWPSAPATLPADWPWLAAPTLGTPRSGGMTAGSASRLSMAPRDASREAGAPECVVLLPGRDGRPWGVMVLGPRLSEEPYSREDHDLLAVVARQAALALENLSLAEQMAARLETERRHAHELSIARDVQQMLLPQRRPPLPTLDYVGTCSQARIVGGDYYDFLDLGPGRVGFVLADIAGKGIAASLLMANLQAIIRSHSSLAAADHEAVLRTVNQLFRDSTSSNRFATMFFGVYDDAARRLAYVNCGHNPPLLVRADGTAEWLAPTAVALGFVSQWQCTTATRQLGDDELLVMYSDGITEAWSEGDEEYGDARLAEVVRASRGLTAQDVMNRVLADVKGFSRAEQSDDWTLIVAKGRRAGSPA